MATWQKFEGALTSRLNERLHSVHLLILQGSPAFSYVRTIWERHKGQHCSNRLWRIINEKKNENEKWKMKSEKWKMKSDNEKWKVKSEKWKMKIKQKQNLWCAIFINQHSVRFCPQELLQLVSKTSAVELGSSEEKDLYNTIRLKIYYYYYYNNCNIYTYIYIYNI